MFGSPMDFTNFLEKFISTENQYLIFSSYRFTHWFLWINQAVPSHHCLGTGFCRTQILLPIVEITALFCCTLFSLNIGKQKCDHTEGVFPIRKPSLIKVKEKKCPLHQKRMFNTCFYYAYLTVLAGVAVHRIQTTDWVMVIALWWP
jgi:hypothetical protein